MTGRVHIELHNLTRHYPAQGGRRRVLDAVEAVIEHGEFVVLVGRSGSGKSTLLNLVGGLDRPNSGDVVLEGQSLTVLGEEALALLRREKVGYMFQFFNLIPTLTVAENLRLPLELIGVDGKDADERVTRWLGAVGLAGREPDFPDELSGGEQQRVALARALIHEPGLLLADEPTGNLDLVTAREVLALLDDLCRRTGTTLLMATHSPEVIGMADRVLTIRDGHLAPMDQAS